MKGPIAIAVTCLLAGGCIGHTLTAEDVATFGRRSYDAPPDKLFAAAKGTLASMGYGIAVENPDKGLIKTNRKVIRETAEAYGSNAVLSVYYRQLTIEIRPAAGGKHTVSVTPRVFEGEQDLSAGPVWVMEGPQGEKALWDAYFTELESNL